MNNTSQAAAKLETLRLLQWVRGMHYHGTEAYRIMEAALDHQIGHRPSTVDPNRFDMLLDGEDK